MNPQPFQLKTGGRTRDAAHHLACVERCYDLSAAAYGEELDIFVRKPHFLQGYQSAVRDRRGWPVGADYLAFQLLGIFDFWPAIEIPDHSVEKTCNEDDIVSTQRSGEHGRRGHLYCIDLTGN